MPKEIKVGYLKVKADLLVPNPLQCFNCNKFGHTCQCCKATGQCQCYGNDKHEEKCDRHPICSNCNGPHTVSAKDCLVWKKEKEIQRIHLEKCISFPGARQLVDAKSPSTGFTSSLSFADMVNKNKSVKSGLSDGSDLGFFGHPSSNCPFCCICFWWSRIGIDRYPGFLQEVRAGFGRRPGTARVRVVSGQEIWVSWCWTQFLFQASDFDPRGWVKVQFRTLTDGARLGISAPRPSLRR